MRILIASGIFHPDSGGPATYLYRLLPELQACGHEIRVIAYGNDPVIDYPYPLTRIRFDTLPVRMARYMAAYREAAAWADLIYLNSLGLPRFSDTNKPRVMKVVGDYAWERAVNKGLIAPTEDIDVFQTKPYNPLVEWFKTNRSREVQAMDRIIVPSHYLRQMVIGWGAAPERVQVIYNALEADGYAPTLSREEARHHLGWKINGRYLVTAARLTAWKGVDYLIEALKRLPEIVLIVAGDGPQYNALRAQAMPLGPRVLFPGKVPHEQMSLYLRAADYLALYSGYEGLSHTILEALYAGTPVIASDRGGNPEVVSDGQNGLLVKHPDIDALVEALRQAFQGDTSQRLATGTSAGLDRFAWPSLVQQTAHSLETVIGGKFL
jgi:glycosyltransferase involved in cell wall biosynthesis